MRNRVGDWPAKGKHGRRGSGLAGRGASAEERGRWSGGRQLCGDLFRTLRRLGPMPGNPAGQYADDEEVNGAHAGDCRADSKAGKSESGFCGFVQCPGCGADAGSVVRCQRAGRAHSMATASWKRASLSTPRKRGSAASPKRHLRMLVKPAFWSSTARDL